MRIFAIEVMSEPAGLKEGVTAWMTRDLAGSLREDWQDKVWLAWLTSSEKLVSPFL